MIELAETGTEDTEVGNMSIFKGSAVAIITPFNTDGSVNYEQFGALIDYQIDHKKSPQYPTLLVL